MVAKRGIVPPLNRGANAKPGNRSVQPNVTAAEGQILSVLSCHLMAQLTGGGLELLD